MSGYMTATAARALYDRAQRPRPSRVTPERNAALAAMLADEIRVARASGAVMAAQGHNGPAAYVFSEVRRMTELRGFYAGERSEAW
ncbi:hypothetical protein LCGC14_0520350 [marine sediment metagenome]|uniref:Uncharacterized protein n=1 Tax=marine sediment metagenome TaxID=412755 RepID=A0A0F9SH14_9ZZZZ